MTTSSFPVTSLSVTTPERLMQFAFGSVPPLMIEAAIHYGVFEILEGEPKALSELSLITGASLRGLKAVLNGLVGLGLLAKNEEAIYSLTSESAAFLVSDKPAYHGGLFQHLVHQILPHWLRLPEVLSVTQRMVEKSGVAAQFSYAEGDLLVSDFGSHHNLAILGHILHSAGEARSRALIAKTYAALSPGGTIVIADWLVNDARTAPGHALIFAVNMLVLTTDGDTFSFPEIRAWLEEAGFESVRLLKAPAPSPLILATKPDFSSIQENKKLPKIQLQWPAHLTKAVN